MVWQCCDRPVWLRPYVLVESAHPTYIQLVHCIVSPHVQQYDAHMLYPDLRSIPLPRYCVGESDDRWVDHRAINRERQPHQE